MCGDCWNAAMAAPTAAVAARFAWVGYKDRIPFLRRRATSEGGATEPDTRGLTPSVRPDGPERDLVDAGTQPPPP